MAVKWLVRSGESSSSVGANSWVDPTMWNDNTVPQPGDEVYTNGFYVWLSSSINVSSISTRSNPSLGINAGGTIYLYYTTDIVVQAHIYSGTTPVLNCYQAGRDYTLVGNVYAGAVAAIASDGQPNITVIGTVYGCDQSNQPGINFGTAGASINVITGNVYARAGAGVSFFTNNNISLTINGNVFADGNYGLALATGIAIVNGFIKGSPTYFGAYAPTPNKLTLTSLYHQADSFSPVSGFFKISIGLDQQCIVSLSDDTQLVLTNPNQIGVFPNESDVRNNTIYANGLKLGTLNVPPKEAVGAGVLVDDTIGEAVFNFADWLAALQVSNNPIAHRLKNVATPESVSEIINSSFNE